MSKKFLKNGISKIEDNSYEKDVNIELLFTLTI